jgi:hypothetical protein
MLVFLVLALFTPRTCTMMTSSKPRNWHKFQYSPPKKTKENCWLTSKNHLQFAHVQRIAHHHQASLLYFPRSKPMARSWNTC